MDGRQTRPTDAAKAISGSGIRARKRSAIRRVAERRPISGLRPTVLAGEVLSVP